MHIANTSKCTQIVKKYIILHFSPKNLRQDSARKFFFWFFSFIFLIFEFFRLYLSTYSKTRFKLGWQSQYGLTWSHRIHFWFNVCVKVTMSLRPSIKVTECSINFKHLSHTIPMPNLVTVGQIVSERTSRFRFCTDGRTHGRRRVIL